MGRIGQEESRKLTSKRKKGNRRAQGRKDKNEAREAISLGNKEGRTIQEGK